MCVLHIYVKYGFITLLFIATLFNANYRWESLTPILESAVSFFQKTVINKDTIECEISYGNLIP